jgi:hypothetical protein
VTVEGTNAPLADARVVLMPILGRGAPPPRPMMRMGPPPQAITDQDGRFAFTALRAGEYHVDVQRTGYAPLGDVGSGRTITLLEGQTIDNLQVHLQKGAVIAGRIVAPSGEPQPDVRVMALRRIEGPRIPSRLVPVPSQGMPQTNDLGEFRLAGLPPGEYFVSAAPNLQSPFGGPAVAPPSPRQSRTALATTYYPGTADAAAAQPVAVAGGAEVDNISFMLLSLPAFRVSGVVVDEDGKPVGGAFVTLMNDPRTGVFMPSGASSAASGNDGRFTIDNVVAGTYHANASVPMPMTAGAGGVATWSISGGRGLTNQPTEVVVTDADVAGVRILVRKPQ